MKKKKKNLSFHVFSQSSLATNIEEAFHSPLQIVFHYMAVFISCTVSISIIYTASISLYYYIFSISCFQQRVFYEIFTVFETYLVLLLSYCQ